MQNSFGNSHNAQSHMQLGMFYMLIVLPILLTQLFRIFKMSLSFNTNSPDGSMKVAANKQSQFQKTCKCYQIVLAHMHVNTKQSFN